MSIAVYHARDLAWRRIGRAVEADGDGFVTGVDRPDENSGNVGLQVPESELQTINGNYAFTAAGQTLTKKRITGVVSMNYANCTLDNCLILMQNPPASGGTTKYTAINSFGDSVGKKVQFCEVRPASPTVDCYGVDGYGITVMRSFIQGVVDAFNSQKNSANTIAGMKAWANRIKTLVYSSDPRQGGGASHSDFMQIFAGVIEYIGNYGTGPVNSGNGLVFNPQANGLPEAVKVKNPVINYNWFEYAYTQIGAWVKSSGPPVVYFDTIPGIDIWGNRHIGTAADASNGGTHRWDVLLTAANRDAATRIGQGYRSVSATDANPTLRTTSSNPPYPNVVN